MSTPTAKRVRAKSEEEGDGGAKIELDQDRFDLYAEYTGFGGAIQCAAFRGRH